MGMKEINTLVKKAIRLQTIEEICNISQMNYRQRLFNYFARIDEVEEFTLDIMHDIQGLKYEDKHFLTRL